MTSSDSLEEPPKLEESEPKVEDELIHDSIDDVPRVRIMSAAEQFTTSANLQYEPLNDFLDIVVRESPDIVILMGPFVDSRHRMMNQSTLPVPYEDIFDVRLMRRILKEAESTRDTKFVLVPSLEDMHHTFVAPQPAFNAIHENISIINVSYPSILEVSGTNQSR